MTTQDLIDLAICPERLIAARTRRRLSQEALARLAGLSQGFVSMAENGGRRASPVVIARLARALDVTVDSLCGLDAEAPAAQGAACATALPATVQRLLDAAALPPGLQALATDWPLCQGLQITPAEWFALVSLRTEPPGLTRDGYVGLLALLRTSPASPAGALPLVPRARRGSPGAGAARVLAGAGVARR